ncbi:MAG: amidohydrolase [Spirulinaceae cyanobacterium RM2_2_10]|nr:amidohydrolase [Spirulinaceae cyanobacterium SM2_1_0]NJO20676.1 amidohydrolase [Spirulinaceae cyanobacterium RM2_2_10]
MLPSPELLQALKTLRRDLHQYPELAGQEQGTGARLQQFLSRYPPDRLLADLGNTGFAAIYHGTVPGPTLAIRGDIDALPIMEAATCPHRSRHANVAHLCGHDGHATILCGVAALLARRRPARGRVVLLWQPAEEIGCGARWLLADPRFTELAPDVIFGLHNLPGFPLGQVVWRHGSFAAASKGLILRLTGATAHAAQPESGRSPALAVAYLIAQLTQLPQTASDYCDFVQVTVVHARLGEVAFGTAPGEAVVMATLRSYRDDDMARLTDRAIALGQTAAQADGLQLAIEWTDEFAATVNHRAAVEQVRQAAIACHYDQHELTTPFRWSEDFGEYTRRYSGAFLGLGAGEQHPHLHQADYDFPDELLERGVKLFATLIRHSLG